jgi:MoaA/NifB/PqqE/SkfB family radical SAM enzyme
VRFLKDRGTYVLFNTNGSLLTERKGREMIDAGLDELRVSLDAAEPKAFVAVRGKNMFDRIVRNVAAFTAMQSASGVARPLVSLWLTGLKETIGQLPEFVRLAHRIGVSEVHLQRLVFMPEEQGLARARSSLFETPVGVEPRLIEEAAVLAQALGVHFNASGATEPGTSLRRATQDQPWSLCRRPWTLMYFTAHGRAIPCCIAPFSMRGYDSVTLGDATQQSLRQIWNGPRYREFRRALLTDGPPLACASCGVRWSL